jgi:hypothetical protein
MFQNFKAKIPKYATVLNVTAPQQTRFDVICDTFVGIHQSVEQIRATNNDLGAWQQIVFEGAPQGEPAPAPQGEPAPAPPVFQAVTPLPTGASIGIFDEFREMVRFLKANPNYTRNIGEDLMIVAPENETDTPDSIAPALEVEAVGDYRVRVTFKKGEFDALRIEYQRKGASNWTLGTIATASPDEFDIAPNAAGQPESGFIRAVYLNRNQQVGNYSPLYPGTLS